MACGDAALGREHALHERPCRTSMPSQPGESCIDERGLRASFGRCPTGVVFGTTELDGTPPGLIVSSFAAVSLRPPLVSFCPSCDSITWGRAIMRAKSNA
jgi:3-hydroxy-9,10-secoandrosta-1,3,5(10)-triene-9,17-dione monooxygenase reductase component